MGNKKVLSKATRELNKTKRVATPKNIIEDPRGQWAHPGEITRIPSDTITMQGVPYPVMAYPNMGEPQMMYPEQEYYFPGAEYVDEYPQMKRGGTPKSLVKMPKPSKKGLASKKFSRSLEATNRLFTEHPLFAKPKSKRRKVFDPNAVYQDGGIMDQEEPTGGITSQEEIDAANRAMMRARLAYAQMHGNSAAQRMVVAPDQPYVYTGEEYDKDWDMPVGVPAGETGTHYMASFGNYAVPFIQQGPNGLYFNELPSIRDREAIRFDNEEDAQYFGGHYKEVAPDKSYRKKIENGSPYITSLSPEDEEQFQRFYNTLPENLQSDDPSYDIRGYWDSEGRPEEFDYSQPKEDDGYYHAYSINQNTGEYLKNPWHPTFQHAIDEDKKIGYRPVVNVKGELIATENPSIADPEEQTFLRNTEGPANYIETELTPEEIEEYRKGGYVIEDISIPSLSQMQDGGIVQLDGYRFKKDDSGNWFYESGAPVTDRALVQRLTYESKPVGSPVVQNAPKPKVNQAVWENAAGTSQKNAIAREKQLQALKASPVLADKEKAEQIEQQRAASEAEYMNQLKQSSQYEQPLDMMDWLWGAAAVAPVVAPGLWAAAESAGATALPYIEGALSTSIPGMASVPGATVGNALGAMAAVDSGRRLLDVPSQVQKGEYADAAANILTGALDIGTAGMISPLYKSAKATATELNTALKAKNPANFKIPEQWYEKRLYDLYDKGTDSYKLVEIDVPQEVIPGRSYHDVKHKLKNLRSDLNITPTEHYLSRIFGRRPIGLSRDRIIADPKDARLFDSNTRYWLNRLYGNTPRGPEVINEHLLAKDYGKLYKEGLSFEEAQEIIKKYNDPVGLKEKYQEGGMIAPLDLDPKTMKRYLADLKNQENNIKKGYRNGKWYPHASPEGGLDTIAYGHKLTSSNSPYYKGITDEQAEALLLKDVLENQALAKKQVDAKFGEGTFDSLPQDRQMLLVDYQYNLGSLKEFPKFVKAVVEGDTETMIAEHKRYGGKDPLTRRNEWTLDIINNMIQPVPEKPDNGIVIPLSNVPDATNIVLPQIEGGPKEAIELELSPEEIKQYQMGGYIVEEVDDVDSPAAPCPPGKIYDPIIQGCVDESVYKLNRQIQKDSINVDDAIRENRRYYKGYKFMEDWMNSPMYDKMLKESARSPESYEYMKKMRQQQLQSTPPLQILPQPEDSPNTGGYSVNSTGQIVILPEGFHTRGTHSHEVSHSSDRPVRGKRSRLIPQRDIDYINKNKAKTIADSRAYHNYKDEYDPMFKEYPEYKKEVDDNFKEFSSDYVGEPTEVRARLNAIRQLSKEAGLYDPFTQGVSPDLYYKKLKNYEFEKGDKSGFDPMKQLQNTFSDEEIIWLLNHMSKTEDNKPELDVAQRGGEYNIGDEVELTEAEVNKLRALGYIIEKA